MIRYFRERLHLSIRAQLDNRGQDLDIWDKLVEKAVDVEAKINLQPLSGTREINSRYPRGHRPSVKKDKDEANREHQNKVPKDKAKFHNSFFANQPQTQAPKKYKRGC